MKKKSQNRFEKAANKIIQWAGTSWVFGFAFGAILFWVITGPIFGFSDTWQLVVNTGTTIITFLMVFLIQKTQNKENKAIQLKLNELIAASRWASNWMVDIEDMNEEELDTLHRFYEHLSDKAEDEENIHRSHSIDAADDLQNKKNKDNNENNGDEQTTTNK